MKPAQISVVIPTLDTKELTKASVDAVLRSSLPAGTRLEVVVVDDGSRDGTDTAFEGRPGVRVLRNDAPTGFSRAVNRGARGAAGDLLVILNSDTEIRPGSLARVVDAFANDAGLGIAGAALRYPDGSPQWSAGPKPGVLWLFGLASGLPTLLGRLPAWRRLKPLHGKAPRDVAWVSGAAMAMRAAVWKEVGPFDETFHFYGQDRDLCLRAGDRGWRVRLLPDFEVVHHLGATISTASDSVLDSQNLALLWNDLVLGGEKRHGAVHARRATRALRAGAVLRLVARQLALPFVPRPRREVWRAKTRIVAKALATLRARNGSPG